MEPVFTIPYPELVVAESLAREFPKRDGYSVSLPLSRQQKGFDLLLYRQQSRKAASIQVKASRSFSMEQPKDPTTPWCKYVLFFKRLRATPKAADFYIFFGLYPRRDIVGKPLWRPGTPKAWWRYRLIVFSDSEMQDFLTRVIRDSFFYFGFNDEEDPHVYLTRGAGERLDYTCNVFSSKCQEIRESVQ